MFGTLTIHTPDSCPFALRLRPKAGLEQGRGLFRMTLFPWVRLTLSPHWKEPLCRRRVGEALARLQAQGVREVLLPREWEPLARERGLVPMQDRAALEARAGEALRQAAAALGLPLSQLGLAVYGRAISPAAHMELLSLARSVRTLRVRGQDNEGLRATLWRGCGIVDRGPMPRGLPVIALRFAGAGETGDEALLTIDLTGEGGEPAPNTWRPDLLLPPGALAQCPPGVPPARLAAAFFTVGALQAREIPVSRLDIDQITPYNKGI